jgi:hypothetical protein
MNLRNYLALPVLLLPLPPVAHAVESAPAAPPPRQAQPAGEHAGHGAHAGTGVTGRSAGRPAAWTEFPTLKVRMGAEGRERRAFTVVQQNIAAPAIDARSNDTKDENGYRQLPVETGAAKLDKPSRGGFHWLSAREEQTDKIKVASTIHFFSERGAQNPTALFMQQKHELEIIPQPFPREHSRYRANEDWEFLVRFKGKPLTGQKVSLETANGTRAALTSDAQGVIAVRIPDDFREEPAKKPGGAHDHGRRGSDIVLATKYAEGGKTYLTAFSSSYGPGAFDQRSLALGFGFTLLGMIGAAPLLRQRKNTKPAAGAAVNKDI